MKVIKIQINRVSIIKIIYLQQDMNLDKLANLRSRKLQIFSIVLIR